jgi:hypothetical protein
MPANNNISVSELDFDKIKANIQTYLQGQSTFSDYNFNGSGLSVLLDILAYNTHYNALYTNLAVNESFIDSASKRSSVVSRAKEIGYIPYSARCATATVNITVTGTVTSPAILVINAGSTFTSTVNNKTFTFYNLEAVQAELVGSSYTFTDVVLTAGTPLTYQYTVADDTMYVIPNIPTDLSTVNVRVQDNASSSNFTTFINQESIVNIDGTSAVYWVKEIEGKQYELEFGNGIIGKALSNGNVVNISYMVSDLTAPNGANIFLYTGPTLLGGAVSVTTSIKASGGSDIESIDSIRFNAPRAFNAQKRAVTANDYQTLIMNSYPNAQSVNVWGGEDNIPPVYGKVFLSIQPKSAQYLTTTEKTYLTNQVLKPLNVVSITPEIVDPEYINLDVTTTVYYNPNLTALQSSDIKTLVTQTIQAYNTNNLNSFTGIFRFSNLSSQIDSTEPSIVSNITTIKLQREVAIQYNTTTTYTINLGNPIYNTGVAEQSILSSGFYIKGNTNKMYIEDLPDTSKTIGQLRMFYYNGSIKTYYSTFGTVNYSTGDIVLSNLDITGIDLIEGNGSFVMTIKPQSNDVVSVRNQLVNIPSSNINVTMVLDQPSVGNSAGGSNYKFTSSYN